MRGKAHPNDQSRYKLSCFLKRLRGNRSQRQMLLDMGLKCRTSTYSAWETMRAYPTTYYLKFISDYACQDFEEFLNYLEPDRHSRSDELIGKAISATNYLNQDELLRFVQTVMSLYMDKPHLCKAITEGVYLIGSMENEEQPENAQLSIPLDAFSESIQQESRERYAMTNLRKVGV